jgi:hypothetical protein
LAAAKRCKIKAGLATLWAAWSSKVLDHGVFVQLRPVFGRRFARPALAVLGCVLLLYVATGLAFLHAHNNGPETTCHVCQVLHAPVLAVARLNLVPEAQQVARNTTPLEHAAPSSPVALHRASRAPPSA